MGDAEFLPQDIDTPPAPAGRPQRLRFGPFVLDTRTDELFRAGLPVRLRRQSLRCLARLAGRSNALLTRDELRRELWDDATFVNFDQGLNTCIKEIRTALGDDAETPRYVETLPGRGYRFLAAVEPQALEGPPAPRVVPDAPRRPAAEPRASRLPRGSPWLAAAAVAALLTVHLASGRRASPEHLAWQQVTFGRGSVGSARFGPGGTVVFTAAMQGAMTRLYAVQPPAPDARLVRDDVLQVVGVTDAGEAVFFTPGRAGRSVLARAPLGGGPIKELLEDIEMADLDPHSGDVAVVRRAGGRRQLEFPAGRALGELVACGGLRVSPDGRSVAVIERPSPGDDGGHVFVFGRDGTRSRLPGAWASVGGLAWSPRGDEVWLSAAEAGLNLGLYALSTSGRRRTLLPPHARLVIHDIAPDGRVLLDRGTLNLSASFGRAGGKQVDLSWFDGTTVSGMSADGKRVLLTESGEAGGPDYAMYLRDTDGSPAVRVGRGRGLDLSPDGRWALATTARTADRLEILPTGAGAARTWRHENVERFLGARFAPGGRLLFVAQERGRPETVVCQAALDGRSYTPLMPAGSRAGFFLPSRDARLAITRGEETRFVLVSIENPAQPPRPLPALEGLIPSGWDGAGRTLYALERGTSGRLYLFDVESGRRTPWMEVAPDDRVGFTGLLNFMATPDLKAYAYSYVRQLSELFVVSGIE